MGTEMDIPLRDEGYDCYNANVAPFLPQRPVHRIRGVSFAVPRHDVAVAVAVVGMAIVDFTLVSFALVHIVCDMAEFLFRVMLLPVHGKCCATEELPVDLRSD